MWRMIVIAAAAAWLQGCCCSCCDGLIPDSVGDQLMEKGAESGMVWVFEQAGAKNPTVDIDPETGSFHLGTDRGTMDVQSQSPSTDGLAVPLPDSVSPKVVARVEARDGSAKVHHVQFESPTDAETTRQFFEDWATEQGFQEMEMDPDALARELKEKTAEGLVPIPEGGGADLDQAEVDVDFEQMADEAYLGVRPDNQDTIYVIVGDDGEGAVHYIEGGKTAAEMLLDDLEGTPTEAGAEGE